MGAHPQKPNIQFTKCITSITATNHTRPIKRSINTVKVFSCLEVFINKKSFICSILIEQNRNIIQRLHRTMQISIKTECKNSIDTNCI